MNNSSTKPHNRLEKFLVASTLRCMVSRSRRLRPRLYEAVQATKALTKGYHNPRRKLTKTVESEVLWTWFRPKRWCDYFAGRVLQVCPVFVKVHREILTAHSLINHYINRKRSVYLCCYWQNRDTANIGLDSSVGMAKRRNVNPEVVGSNHTLVNSLFKPQNKLFRHNTVFTSWTGAVKVYTNILS